LILSSSPHKYIAKLAYVSLLSALMLIYENLRLRTSLDGEREKASFAACCCLDLEGLWSLC
jgi:hypothetical protein